MLCLVLFLVTSCLYTTETLSFSWTQSLGLQPGCSLIKLNNQGLPQKKNSFSSSAFSAETGNCNTTDLLFGPVYYEGQCIIQPFDDKGDPQQCENEQEEIETAFIDGLNETNAGNRVRLLNQTTCYEALENVGYYDLDQLRNGEASGQFSSGYVQDDVLCVETVPTEPAYALVLNECDQTIDLQWKINIGDSAKDVCGGDGLSDWQIILIVIGGIVAVIFSCLILCCILIALKKKQQRKEEQQQRRYFRSYTVNPQLGRMNLSGKQGGNAEGMSGKWTTAPAQQQIDDHISPPIVV